MCEFNDVKLVRSARKEHTLSGAGGRCQHCRACFGPPQQSCFVC